MNLYEVLGAAKNASPTEIEAAYRRQAKIHHSDREGGSNEKMSKINVAYAVLSDAAKRKQYDDTGEYNQGTEETIEEAAIRSINALIAHTVEETAVNPDTPIVKSIDVNINRAIEESVKQKVNVEKIIKNLKRKRTSYKAKNDTLIGHVIDDRIVSAELALKHIDKHIAIVKRTKEMFDENQYEDLLFETSHTSIDGLMPTFGSVRLGASGIRDD